MTMLTIIENLSSSAFLVSDQKNTVTPVVLPFGLEQLTLMSAACELDDPQQFLEAICSTVPNIKPEQLTIGDLLQLAIYHRMKAFPDSPIEINWKCNGVIVKDATTGEAIDYEAIRDHTEIEQHICGSENLIRFTEADYPIVYLDNLEGLDSDLALPSATLYPEIVQLAQQPMFAKLVNIVSWIKDGNTIQDKLDILSNQTDLDLFDRASKASKKYQHGPKAIIKAECPNCGTPVSRKVTINATSFFR